MNTQNSPPAGAPGRAQLEALLSHAIYAQNLHASRRHAERQYGREHTAALHDWATHRCATDPHFNHAMFHAEDPYEAAYQALRWERSGAPPRVSAPAPSIPRSLVNAPGNGAPGRTYAPMGPGEAFAATIRR